jgi:hypothetical protein
VPADGVSLFREQAERALAAAHAQSGLVHAHVGRQAHRDGAEQIVFVSVWRDLESLYGWVGSDLLSTPLLVDCPPGLFDDYDIQHYEVVDLGPEVAEGIGEIDQVEGPTEGTPVGD